MLQNVLQTLLEHTIQVVVLIATPILLKLANDWLKAHGLEQMQTQVSEAITKAVSYAEQTSLAQVRKGAPALPGEKKLEAAVAFTQDEVKRMKLPEIQPEHLEKMIEAQVFQQKIEPQATTTPPAAAVEEKTEIQ